MTIPKLPIVVLTPAIDLAFDCPGCKRSVNPVAAVEIKEVTIRQTGTHNNTPYFSSHVTSRVVGVEINHKCEVKDMEDE